MGGWGSGRWTGVRTRPTTQHSCSISIGSLRRHGLLDPGKQARLEFTRRGMTSSFTLRSCAANFCQMSWTRGLAPGERPEDLTTTVGGWALTWRSCPYKQAERPDAEWSDHRQLVRVLWTRPNFGGWRAWFECPCCDARVGKLYFDSSNAEWSCRTCQNLTYSSSNASGDTIATIDARINALCRRYRVTQGPWTGAPPRRPDGMSAVRYRAFWSQYVQLCGERDIALSNAFRAMASRLERSMGR